MDVTAAGTALPNRLDSLAPLAPPANPAPAAGPQSTGVTVDRIADTLQDLAAPQIGQVLHLLEPTGASQDPMMLEGLLNAAVASVHAHRIPEAIKTIQHLVSLSPEHGL